MTLSPVEGAHLTSTTLAGFIGSESPVLVGGIVTGPLFGWSGHLWRVRRALLGALATGLLICLEPVVRVPAHREIRSMTVTLFEVAVALLYVVVAAHRRAEAG